ncbi:MAG: NAD-dependent epimerase/dehydratase family protein, partial [Candidatus Odinarchaeota archaeon]
MKNIKVLVTGAGGFIGSHLADKLTENDYTVRAFVKYNS